MSGSTAVGAHYISFTAGGSAAAGTGAFTIAALIRPTTGNNNCGIATLLASGVRQRTFFEDSLMLWGESDFTGFTPSPALVQGNWYVWVLAKAAGSSAYTFYVWLYDPVDFTGAVSTGTSQTVGDGSAVDEIRFGQAIDNANALYGAIGVWNRKLSLAEVQSMRSNQLASWANVSGGAPQTLIHLRDWNGTSGAVVALGTNTVNGVTGTVSAGANPPSFNFDIASDITIQDSSGGGGTGGGADSLTLGDSSGGGGTGGSTDLFPSAVQDTSGGGGTGGSADTVVVGSAVVHDQMVMPIALQVKTCLVAEVGKLANPPAQVQIRPGATFSAMYDSHGDECCLGIAYVRPGAQVPTTGNWPTPLTGVDGPSASGGRAPYYAVNFEIGIYRCIPVVADDGTGADNFPTGAQWLQAAQDQLDDAAALRRVICCLQAFYGLDSVIAGQVQPLENSANCGGIMTTVAIRATACDCV